MDSRFMRRALSLAARGAGHTSPNPMVGAVIVADGRIVGEGYHRALGSPHAEVDALRHAGAAARNATLYVTLEPCAHQGRTAPCAQAVIAAGVTRVVAAIGDPDPRTNGRGFAALRAAGVELEEGVLAGEAERLSEGFLMRVRKGRPFVVLKLAMTTDGRVTVPGRRYLVDQPAIRFVHRLRARSDAVMVGIGTVLADDPELTVRAVRGRDPLRVVLDTDARTPVASKIVRRRDPERTVVVVADDADPDRVLALSATGVDVVRTARGDDGRVDAGAALRHLAGRGVNNVLSEGGPRVATALLRRSLADRLLLIIAPLLGGSGPRAFGDIDPMLDLDDLTIRRLGRDLAISAELGQAR
ncbi:MAG: bifunctional diaminohydroxyphosphoribosylaminopyrimidine deaminase/5-amino-6-(5-phosphoribosylamino)uracil reductase RibD [Candidatus Limnocylindrales bacterium]